MKFGIQVWHNGHYIRLRVEQIYTSDQVEKYEIIARNKSLTIQSNRPLLKAKGLKTRRPDYKLIAGSLQYYSLLEQIIEVLHQTLMLMDNPGMSRVEWVRGGKL